MDIKYRHALGIVVAAVLASACAGDVDERSSDQLSDDEPIASVTQALDSSWITGPFTAGQNSDVPMDLDTTHVCVLTKVSGRFAGGGESIQVVRVSGRWRLITTSGQHGVSAEAYCFKKTGFLANGSSRWVSEQWARSRYGNGTCGTTQTTAWAGDATTYVSGMKGAWNGGCEYATVFQNPSGTANSTFTLGAGTSESTTHGYAQSFFAGTPGAGVPAKFFNAGQTFSVGSNQSVVMSEANTTMCHFVELKGDFNGGGEWAQIKPIVVNGVEKWQLLTGALGGSGVSAKARCYLRDQR